MGPPVVSTSTSHVCLSVERSYVKKEEESGVRRR